MSVALIDDADQAEFERAWQEYKRWAIPPLMTREMYEIDWAFVHSDEPKPTNPYEWGAAAVDWARRTGRLN
jgi:hypothetical protein